MLKIFHKARLFILIKGFPMNKASSEITPKEVITGTSIFARINIGSNVASLIGSVLGSRSIKRRDQLI